MGCRNSKHNNTLIELQTEGVQRRREEGGRGAATNYWGPAVRKRARAPAYIVYVICVSLYCHYLSIAHVQIKPLDPAQVTLQLILKAGSSFSHINTNLVHRFLARPPLLVRPAEKKFFSAA